MNRAMPTFQKSYDINLLLERKLKACQHFLATTRELKNALAAEEMSAVMHLIQDREKLIHVIGVLDNLINPEELSDLMGQREDLFQDLRLILERIARENIANFDQGAEVITDCPGCALQIGRRRRVSHVAVFLDSLARGSDEL